VVAYDPQEDDDRARRRGGGPGGCGVDEKRVGRDPVAAGGRYPSPW
jgi:hypothetical protein